MQRNSHKSRSISCLPGFGWHAYQDAFYSALNEHHFSISRETDFTNSGLKKNTSDFLHFHWIERFWESPSMFNQAKAIWGVRSYLRLAKQLNKKIIWTVHNHFPHEDYSIFHRQGMRQFAEQADLIICHSKWSQKWILQTFPNASEPLIMPHGNFEKTFSPYIDKTGTLEKFGLKSDIFTVGMIGVIRHNRGHENTINAVKSLGKDAQLLIVGRNKDVAYLQSLRDIISTNNNIAMHNINLPDEEYNRLVASCDVVTLPYDDITTSGALLSSWTIGTPTITSDLPYFREFAPKEHAGAVINCRSTPDLVSTIKKFKNFERDITRQAAMNEAKKYQWSQLVKPVAERLENIMMVRKCK